MVCGLSCLQQACRSPRGERGLKLHIRCTRRIQRMSLPVRGASQADTFGNNRLDNLSVMRLALSPSQLMGTKVSGAILLPPLLIRVLRS